MSRLHIPFMKNRWIMLSVSAVLIVVSIASIAVRGLNFGIEFRGGTVVTISGASNVPIEKMRAAVNAAGLQAPEIQTVAKGGFIIRTSDTDPNTANTKFAKVSSQLGISAGGLQVTTIGPDWGQNITNSAILAFVLSILAILLYISVRFSEWKMAVAAVIALAHDLIITLGIYSLFGFEVTPNTIAALLAILGYSLYDTIVVFHRIKENSQNLVKQSFIDMANDSINQVFTRSINTSLTALIPVVSMLLLGGSTLKEFAFALTVGLISGAYSSIGVAAPIYAMWKSTEPKYKALAKKYGTA